MASSMIPLGPFDLIRPVARGGMAEVWLARHREQGVPVAVKVLTSTLALQSEFEQRFSDEVRAVAALDHPGVVMVLDHGRMPRQTAAGHARLVEGSPWLAMEYASGGTLAHLAGPLPWPMLKTVLMALLDALGHAHAHGVVHRDLKPPNVLVAAKQDARPGIKLSDFGIAWAGGPDHGGDQIMGTPSYMAPEQIRGQWRDFGPWTDLYAFGCLVWWLCSGKAPFHGRNVNSTLVAHLQVELPPFEPRMPVPEGFDPWLYRLLSKSMEQRYQCAADAAWALSRLGDPVTVDEGEVWELDPAFQQTLTTTDVSFGESWRLALDEPSLATEAPLGSGGGPRVAPMPDTWRRPVPKPPPMQLVGAGLSLYGLRAVQLAGREEERDLLWSELREVARTQRARLVLIQGPAGTGKSRLVEWLCRRGHELGALTWCKAVFSKEKAPGEALVQMANDYVRTSGLPRADVGQRVRTFLRRHGSSDEDEAEVLTELMCPATDDDLERGALPVRLTRPREYYVGTANTFYRVSRERPLVAWFDDVQWGLHGLGLALEVLRSQQERPFPCLLLLTMRSEALEDGSDEARRLERLMEAQGARSMALGPLPPAAHRELVRGLLGLDDVLAARVEERTGGNPLFAVQLVGSWVQDGTLEVSQRGFRLKPGARAVLPDDLHAVWSAQIGRVLSEFQDQAFTYLEVAACLGMEIDSAEWGRACDDPEGHFGGRFVGDAALRASLVDRLLAQRLVVGTLERWSFVHGMLRESLQRTAQAGGRWKGHQESCAAMLAPRAQEPRVAERFGRHLLEAGRLEEALEPLLRGVEHRLVTIGAQPAQALLAMVEDAMRELGVPPTDARWGRLWTLAARVHADLGDPVRALEEARRARNAAEKHGWAEVGLTALLAEGRLLLGRRRLGEARRLLERLRAEAEARGDDGRLGAALAGLADVERRQGDFQGAARLQDAALLAFGAAIGASQGEARLGWESERAAVLVERGRSAESAGDLPGAAERYREALERFETLGSGLGAAECLDRLARLAFEGGELEEAESLFQRALSRYEALGGDRQLPCRMRLARTVLRRDAGRVWPIIEKVQPLLGRLDHTGRVAASLSFQLLRAALDGAWSAYDELLAEAATKVAALSNAKSPVGAIVVAWLGHLAGEACVGAGEGARGEMALRASALIWRAMGNVGQAAEVESRIG